MHRRRFLAAAAAGLCPCLGRAADSPHWEYQGHYGPQNWGQLSPDFSVCGTGREQSPVDLTGAIEAEIPNLAIRWNAGESEIGNTGHTIQVTCIDGGQAEIDGQRYDLVEYHFHSPSEHTVDGRYAPMEVHFVHRHASGALAIIGVLVQAGAQNPLLHIVMSLAPEEAGTSPAGTLDPRGLIGATDRMWRYQGSLTTPPCAETVLWTVLHDPVEAAQKDIDRFMGLFPLSARPLQPLNRRFLLSG